MLLGEYPKYNAREYSTIGERMPDEARRNIRDSNQALLDEIDQGMLHIKKSIEHASASTEGYYQSLYRLFQEFRVRVQSVMLPTPLPEWWSYRIDITYKGISLRLEHFDMFTTNLEGRYLGGRIGTSYELFSVKAKVLSVEEFAKQQGVEVVTVRQWIRRGKIRSAYKTGSEWRISELTIVLAGQKNDGWFSWTDDLDDIPDEYSYFKQYDCVSIGRLYGGRQLVAHFVKHQKQENVEPVFYDVDLTKEEFERMEMFMIAHPQISYEDEMLGFLSD